MPTTRKQMDFLTSEEGIESERLLRLMVDDAIYDTTPSYSANTKLYPDNRVSFVQKHMAYLCSHPAVDPLQYISNLRLISRKK